MFLTSPASSLYLQYPLSIVPFSPRNFPHFFSATEIRSYHNSPIAFENMTSVQGFNVQDILPGAVRVNPCRSPILRPADKFYQQHLLAKTQGLPSPKDSIPGLKFLYDQSVSTENIIDSIPSVHSLHLASQGPYPTPSNSPNFLETSSIP